MACRIGELVLKCRDPEVLVRFWCEVLDFIELDREQEGCIEIGPREGFGGPQPTIFLICNGDPRNGHARLHIDVNPPTAIKAPSSSASWPPGPDSSTSVSLRRQPGTSSPIQKATSSACSSAASTHSDGPGPSDQRCRRSAAANKT